ncbi:hypothetical protein NUH88_20370 [Nisaea acidiphila]|uniref:Calcium-binding protein n=1 Tax=Nisaea acidiphila TaxID=1862145 RepID=A0A9J7ATT9_9PROT|nr:hypothetical protein [Nisaea acidiphila]UUX49740.1 hypothetical protein NUH88_20370 [Nisaea acidiphila]
MATISGTSGSDLLTGSSDSDTINGGHGSDTIIGSAGSDLLNADGAANDLSAGGQDLTIWTSASLSVSDTGNGVYTVQDGTTTAYYYMGYNITNVDTTDAITVSVAVRADTRTNLILNVQDSAPNDVTFDLETGAVDYLGVGFDAGINDLGDGWQQIWVTVPANDLDTSSPTIYLVPWDPSSEPWPRAGTGQTLFEVRDFQFEPGATEPTHPAAFSIDVLSYEESAAAVAVDLSTGTVSGGDATGDTIDGFEGVIGSAHNDTLIGDEAANILSGGGGNDILDGRSEADLLHAGNGNDLLLGGSNADTLYGSYGDDTVEGGTGADLLFGGGPAGDFSAAGDDVPSGGGDLTTWTATGLVVSDAGDGIYEIQDDSVNGYHYLSLPISGVDIADTVTVSVVVRAGSRSDLILNLQDSAPNDVTFDLETGAVDYLGVGFDAGINDLGDGWQQIWLTVPANDLDTSSPTAHLVAWAPSSETWPRQGTGEVLFDVRDFQFEPGATSPSLPDAFDLGTDMLSYESSTAAVTVDLSTGAVSGGDATGDTIDGFDGVIGSAYDDMLTGDDQDNILSGGDGNDTLSGGNGADTIEGGIGADKLYGRSGDVSAGGGDLTAWTPTGLVVSDVGGGVYEVQDDTSNGYHQLALSISGFDTSDTVTVSLVVRAGSRSELILNLQDSAPSDVTFDLETGVVDYLGVGIPAGINDLGDGWQQIWVTAPADSIDTSNPTAYLVAWDPSSETWPRQGTGEVLFEVRDFQFEPGAASPSLPDAFDLVTDMLSYESSAAAVTVDLSTGAVSGGDAAGDTIDGFEGVIGSAHDDMLTGDDQANVLSGGDGNDTLSGGDGADALYGGAGNDVLYDDGTDTLYGGDGFDIVYTDETSDFSRFHGFEEIRSLDGSVILGDDGEAYTGDSGDDLVYGGTGNDTIDGASGNDTLYGGNGDDSLTGNAGDDLLYGGDGDDLLRGYGGDDTLYGEAGNDHLSAGGDDDLIYGGVGNDTINGRGGDDTIYGEDGDDHITTGFSNDAGSDVVIAGNGADTVIGFTGNDTIFGNAGSDSLFGDSGADYIAGGVDDDTLTGGGGADVFAFNTGDNADVITDFVAGTDRLDLDASFGITSQTALDAIASADQSGNTILDFGNGDTITLIGTNPSELSINDIV